MTQPIGPAGYPSPRTIAAVPFKPQSTTPGPDANLTLGPATPKISIRTLEQIAPVLRAKKHNDQTTLWLGPGEYLVFGDGPPPINADSAVDVSHRTVAFHLDGSRSAQCLNAFCGLDLDEIPENGCARTLFGKAEIILWRLGETAFHIETARSYASYVWALLEEARREFLPPPATC